MDCENCKKIEKERDDYKAAADAEADHADDLHIAIVDIAEDLKALHMRAQAMKIQTERVPGNKERYKELLDELWKIAGGMDMQPIPKGGSRKSLLKENQELKEKIRMQQIQLAGMEEVKGK